MSARPQENVRPAFEISIDGTPLPVPVALRVDTIVIDKDLDQPDMCTIDLIGGERDKETAWIDDDTFPLGSSLEIKFGYGRTLQVVAAAEITGLEPSYRRDGPPRLTVRAHDQRHRLLRGRKTRSFVQQKDSDIAATVASDAGLSAQTEDSQVVHDYVLQANQTDMEFLKERARRIQYEVVIEAGTLRFRPAQNAQAEAFTLTLDEDLLEFQPRFSALGQMDELAWRGWNPKDKEEIVASAKTGDETSTMGGSDSAAALAANAFGAGASQVCTKPVFTQAEADQLARARFNRAALELVIGDGVCSGRTDLQPGQVIKLDGLGTRFSGQYYVCAIRHRYSPRLSYQTQFTVRRNAL